MIESEVLLRSTRGTRGTRGTRETEVLDGEFDHRDTGLTDDETAANDTMTICVSRAKNGRVVLDL
ncbi:oxidoreductase [Streptomyces solisilvae]|uniref:oxidoreductase n=1 Tax=Streptomyces malaysiensis TaxID=92644 RepID=UPI003677C78C